MRLRIFIFLFIAGLVAVLFLFNNREELGVPASAVIPQPRLIDNVDTTVPDSVQLTERESEKKPQEESISPKEATLIKKAKYQLTGILRTMELQRTKPAFTSDSEKYFHAAVTIAPADDRFRQEAALFRKFAFDGLGETASRKMEEMISDFERKYGSDKLTMVLLSVPHDESEPCYLQVAEVTEAQAAANMESKSLLNAASTKETWLEDLEKGWRYERLFKVEDVTNE